MNTIFQWNNPSLPMKGKYVMPQMVRISLCDNTNKLYNLEDKRSEIIEECAREHGKVLGFTEKQYWTHSLPFQLLSLLESYDKELGINVCEAYLNYFKK